LKSGAIKKKNEYERLSSENERKIALGDRDCSLILMKQPFMRMDRCRKLISLSGELEKRELIIKT